MSMYSFSVLNFSSFKNKHEILLTDWFRLKEKLRETCIPLLNKLEKQVNAELQCLVSFYTHNTVFGS